MDTSEVIAGIREVSKAVATTYGPGGKPAALDRAAGLTWTRDGLTVVREVRTGGVRQLGADLVQEGCARTNERAGDGTSATCLIASRAVEVANKWVRGGMSSSILARQMRLASLCAVKELQKNRTLVEDYDLVELIGLRASGGDKDAAKGIREALEGVGIGGTVVVEAGMGRGVETSYLEGLVIRSGAKRKDQLPSDGERSMEDPFVVVSVDPLRTEEDVFGFLSLAANLQKTLMVFAPQIEGQALATLVLNDNKKVVRSIAVEVPGNEVWRERYLLDIAAISSAQPIDRRVGRSPNRFDMNQFGLIRHGSVTSQRTVLVPILQESKEIQVRIEQIRTEAATSTSEYDRDRHAERLACLSGALCTLRIGGTTEPEARERRTRVEDAVRACQGAIEQGVVPGGGVGYWQIAQTIRSNDTARQVVAAALEAPARTIADQLGMTWEDATKKITQQSYGWTGVESWDSVLAVEQAIQNGIEIAATTIECGYVIRKPIK